MSELPEKLLGLPGRDSVPFAVPGLSAAYTRFVRQFVLASKGVILSSPYALGLPLGESYSSLKDLMARSSEEQRADNLLMALFCRPLAHSERALTRKTASKESVFQQLFDFFSFHNWDDYEAGVGDSSEAVMDRMLAQVEKADQFLDCLLSISCGTPLAEFSAEFFCISGGGESYNWILSEWSDEWAVVYLRSNGPSEVHYSAPWILGFCRRDNLERNFIELLEQGSSYFDQGFYSSYGNAEGPWPRACMALSVQESEDRPDWDMVTDLMSLDDEAMACLVSQSSEGNWESALARIREIRERADCSGLESLTLGELMTKAGTKVSLKAVEDRLDDWEDDYEKAMEEEKKRRAAMLDPFVKQIEQKLKSILGPRPRAGSANSGMGYGMKRNAIRAFLENYAIEFGALPTGKHDLGRTHYMTIGVVDFGGEIVEFVKDELEKST